MSNWEALSNVVPPPQTLPPAPGDPKTQLPYAFISAVKTRRSASQSSSQIAQPISDSSLSSKVESAMEAISELHVHFSKFVDDSNVEQLKTLLKGNREGEVVWVSPEARDAFVRVVPRIAALGEQSIGDNAEWLAGLKVDGKLVGAGIECAESALREVEQFFAATVRATDEIWAILREEKERAEQDVR